MYGRSSGLSVSDSANGSERGAFFASSTPRAAFSITRAGTHSSASPSRFARRASMVRPLSSRSSAAGAPMSRGSRRMPPQPGTMPSITSGSPSRVPGSSTTIRYRHASASSSPPPRQKPRTSATVGYGTAASRSNVSHPRRTMATAPSASCTSRNSSTSAPAMKPLALPDAMTSPAGGSRSSASSAPLSSASASAESVFALAPALSKLSRARPSAPRASVQCRIVKVIGVRSNFPPGNASV